MCWLSSLALCAVVLCVSRLIWLIYIYIYIPPFLSVFLWQAPFVRRAFWCARVAIHVLSLSVLSLSLSLSVVCLSFLSLVSCLSLSCLYLFLVFLSRLPVYFLSLSLYLFPLSSRLVSRLSRLFFLLSLSLSLSLTHSLSLSLFCMARHGIRCRRRALRHRGQPGRRDALRHGGGGVQVQVL
jgi:hypothetical protein